MNRTSTLRTLTSSRRTKMLAFRMVGIIACAVGCFILIGANQELYKIGSFILFMIGALSFATAEVIVAINEQTEVMKQILHKLESNSKDHY